MMPTPHEDSLEWQKFAVRAALLTIQSSDKLFEFSELILSRCNGSFGRLRANRSCGALRAASAPHLKETLF